MKHKLYSRTLSLLLTFALCIGMLQGVAQARDEGQVVPPDVSSERSEETNDLGNGDVASAAVDAGPWKMQAFGGKTDMELKEGWITPDDEGTGFIADYGKIYTETGGEQGGGNVVIYNSEAPVYANSVLEFDVTVTGGQANKYQVAFFPRFQDGQNCDGMAIGDKASLEHSYQVKGSQDYPGVPNKLDMSFLVNETYHLKMVTIGNHMKVYAGDSLLTEFDARNEITDGTYGFRIWTQIDTKTVHIANIERREYITSTLDKTSEMIPEANWGKADVNIPVTLGKNDTVVSVSNSRVALAVDEHYTVNGNSINLKAAYIESQSNSFKLTVNFAGGSSGEITMTKLAAGAEEPELLHYYTFDERSGDSYADSSENAHAVNGAKNGVIGSVNGRNGKALMLGGTGCVQFESDTLRNLTSYSVSAWVNWDGTLGASNTIFSGHEDWFHIRKQDGNDKKLWLGYFQGGDKWSDVGQNSKLVTPNEWVHVAYVKDGATVSLYLNGELQGTANDVTTPAGKVSLFYIGGNGVNGGAHPFHGMIDELKVFSTPLTQGDIAAIIAVPADVVSTLPKTETIIKADDWGENNVTIPVTFGTGDSVKSIMNGGVALEATKDYVTDENGITLKKDYVKAQNDSFTLSILFEKGSDATFAVNQLNTTIQEHTWTAENGIDTWEKLSGTGTFEMEEGGLRVKGELALVNTASPACLDGEVEITYKQLNDDGNAGVLFRANAEANTWQGVWQDNGYMQRFYFKNNVGTQGNVHGDCTFPFERKGYADHKMKIRLQGDTVTVWLDDQFVSSTEVKAASSALGKLGLYTGGHCDILLKKAVFRNVLPFTPDVDDSGDLSIARGGMTVQLANNFPRVKEYTVNSKTLSGTEFKYDYVTINTVDYPATATVKVSTTDSVTYTVTPQGCDVTFDVVFAVLDGHVLEMRINSIDDTRVSVNSIGFPNQPLISANNSQTGAKLDATVFQENMFTGDQWDQTTLTERHYVVAENKMSKTVSESATLAVVTNDGLSASMANNVLYNIHEFQIKAFDLPQGGISAGVYNTEFVHRGLDGEKMFPIASEPEESDLYCRVVVTEDTNGDNLLDWQDGANALKTIIGDKIPGGDKAARSFFQVGYNFVSEAQQPFIKVGDNLKRMSNLIDGFDQILVLKGYANEGHDSAHADYDDISKRAGGAEDLNAMTDAIKDINATFGIHINNSEAYPEAKMFTDEVMTDENAWKWMDQSKHLRREVDILNDGMDTRLNSLFEKAPDIGFVYVDTYGDDRWCSSRIADNLIGNGAMMGTENKNDLDRYVSWVHWPAINANSMHHFVYHTQKDVYGDTASPIYWGGYSRAASFMSWQHNTNINPIVEQFYTNQLPQKYLMCHEVLKATNTEAIFEGDVTSSNWVITKGGNKITDGPGKIFIPWFDENSVTRNPDEAAKIYHWNASGGKTTWYLPEDWNVQNVYLYENTQTGRKLVETIEVKDGQVTIDAKAKTPYMVYPGAAAADVTEWSVGSPIKDTGFNSRDFSVWQKTGEANIQLNDNGDGVSILTMEGIGEGSVSQTMTGLVPGQKYRALVWAGAENGKTARITVETPDGKTYTNYVDQTVRGNNCYDTYARNMWVDRVWVDFVQPEGQTTATFTLSADACESENGKATFMETRIVKTVDPGLPTGDDTRSYVAYETFEYIEQGGTGIFTPEGGGDGGYHLSETHLPYTKDTIPTGVNGEVSNWSLKMYGAGRATMRTRPSSMRLLPNTTYTMEFDILGSGKVTVQSEANDKVKVLEENITAGHTLVTFTTDDRTDYIARFTGCDVLDNFQVYIILDETPPTVPANLTAQVAEDNSHVVLAWEAAADEDSGISSYNIYRNGQFLVRVSSKMLTYTDNTVCELQDYTYRVSAINGGNTEGPKSTLVTAEVGPDLIKPTVTRCKVNNFVSATLTFSEPLNKASAENTANYTLTGTIATVAKAALQADGVTVELTLYGLGIEDNATLTVTGVKDAARAGNASEAQPFVIGPVGTSLAPGKKYEAEDAKLGGGLKESTVHGGYSGRGFVEGYYQNNKASMTFTVEVPEEGDYDLAMTYACTFKGPQNLKQVINGTDVKIVGFPTAGGTWATWGSYSETAHLQAGVNTIEYKQEPGIEGTINPDYLSVASVGKSITALSIGDATGVIDAENNTVTIALPEGTDVTNLAPTIIVSKMAAISPASGTAQDFTEPVTYTITAENGTRQTYTIIVKVRESGLNLAPIDEAISAAEAAKEGISVNEGTPADVPSGEKFVSRMVMDAMENAIKAAADAKKTAATAAEVAAAAETMTADTATFTAAIQTGTYVPPYVPPTNNTDTETEKNEDGSTTKTVTDKKTGNVTETTTYPDGTKIVATTPKGGETSIEVTVPKNKDSITITIPTDKQPGPGEVAVIVHEDGTREIIKTSVSTEDGLRVTLTGNAKLEIVDNSKSFADMAEDNWAYDAVQFAASRELFQGTGGDSFSPAGDMTRSMLITVLARLDGQDTAGGETWYSKAMDWGEESGITDGTNADASITRESLVVMLYRYAKVEKTDGMALEEFSDTDEVSGWASEAMGWAVANGILNGSGGKLNPTATATRAEVAAMLQRFIAQ